MIFRPVAAGFDSLTNVQTKWSLMDLFDSFDVIDEMNKPQQN